MNMPIKRMLHFFLVIIFISITITCKKAEGDLENPFYTDPATQDFSKNPELLERIKSGPHGYFRFINIIFSNGVCNEFSEIISGSPSLNLHGDAHIEQYAVTDLGRGLTDFDDSSTGPAILDWMRFGVSLQLACYEQGWKNHADELFAKFLEGYQYALDNPETEAPTPTIEKRIKSKFTEDRENYFKWIDSVMEPMPETERDSLLTAMKPYFEMMLAENGKLKEEYFSVIDTGYLRMGIGSALDLKYLIRIQAETDNPLDDIVLEVKQVRDLSGIDCINTINNPYRILLGQARIAYQPFKNLGYFQFRDNNFWVHSWVENYEEVKIGETFKTVNEMSEVVYDAGVQLGRGHVKHIAAPFDSQVRRQQLQILTDHEMEIKQKCREFADLTIEAWQKFKDAIGGRIAN
jgi:hypothetical protein